MPTANTSSPRPRPSQSPNNSEFNSGTGYAIPNFPPEEPAEIAEGVDTVPEDAAEPVEAAEAVAEVAEVADDALPELGGGA